MNLSRFVFIATLALGLGGATAQASTLFDSGVACSVGSMDGATACAGIFGAAGNSENDNDTNVDGLFGVADWTRVLKLDASSGTESGNGITLTVTNTGKGGTWSVDSYGGFMPVMFVTKGGPSFSAFLMDLSTLSGSWNTLSMLGGNGRPGAGLSHWSIYQAGLAPIEPGPGTSPVPLPGAAWLLVAGLGAMTGVRRIRR